MTFDVALLAAMEANMHTPTVIPNEMTLLATLATNKRSEPSIMKLPTLVTLETPPFNWS